MHAVDLDILLNKVLQRLGDILVQQAFIWRNIAECAIVVPSPHMRITVLSCIMVVTTRCTQVRSHWALMVPQHGAWTSDTNRARLSITTIKLGWKHPLFVEGPE